MRDERCADRLARALNDVEHAGRNAGLERQLRHDDRGHRRLLGRLEDDTVAGAQRKGTERGRRRGAVPRHDGTDHANGLANLTHDELVRHRRHAPVELRRPAGVVLEAVNRELGYEAGVHAEQAGVDHVEVGQLVSVLGD